MAEGKFVTTADLSLPQGGALRNRNLVRCATCAVAPRRRPWRRALAITGGNISKTAELLGVIRPTLYDLLERMSIRATDGGAPAPEVE
jgi:two-component system, NtrC family, response regulator